MIARYCKQFIPDCNQLVLLNRFEGKFTGHPDTPIFHGKKHVFSSCRFFLNLINGCRVQELATPCQDLGATSVVPAPQQRTRTDPKAFLPSLKKQTGRNYFRQQSAMQDGVRSEVEMRNKVSDPVCQTLERKNTRFGWALAASRRVSLILWIVFAQQFD